MVRRNVFHGPVIIISIGKNATMNILHQTFRMHPQISSGIVGFVVFGLGDVLSKPRNVVRKIITATIATRLSRCLISKHETKIV